MGGDAITRKPPRRNRRSDRPIDGEVVYERRDLERKRETSREIMRRLRAERRRQAAEEASATPNAETTEVAENRVDGNSDVEYGETES